jgi:hypothetical protein
MKDKADEQLNEAYSRSIIVHASEIVIRPSVQGMCINSSQEPQVLTTIQFVVLIMSCPCPPFWLRFHPPRFPLL